MDKTAYSNHAQGWELAEKSTLNSESGTLAAFRAQAESAGFPQCSVAQGSFLRFLAGRADAASIILLGTGSVVEAIRLMDGLSGRGQFTAVDSSPEGASLIRQTFQEEERRNSVLRLRAVNTSAGTYFPRLNPADYDLIVVSGDCRNYQDAMDHAPRLLKSNGQLVFTDAFALDAEPKKGGIMNPANRSDKAVTLRTLMDTLSQEDHLESCLVPVGNGMVLAAKNKQA